MNRRARASIAALLLGVSCAQVDSPATAADAALLVFELAGQTDPDPGALQALFGAEAGTDLDRRAALGDTLEHLGRVSRVRVTGTETLDGLEVTAVDLEGDLPGGGLAFYTVQLESAAQGSWRVAWLTGPGVAWPPRRRGRGLGLSTSSPPPGSGDIR